MSSLEVSRLFSDHLVMQRGRPNPIWGWDAPGQELRLVVEREGKKFCEVVGQADSHGAFRVLCPPLAPPGPYRVRVLGTGEVCIEDVVVGEVWMVSGQSNMEWPVASSKDAEAVMAAANSGQLRSFKVPRRALRGPERRIEGGWSVATPKSVGAFSAVAYFFARELEARLDLPIGIVDTSWGGSRIEPWMSLEALGAVMPELPQLLLERKESLPHLPRLRREYSAILAEWEAASFPPDPGNVGFAKGFADREFDDADWGTMTLPAFWQSHGLRHNGVVWFRRVITVPQVFAGHDLIVHLGPVDDYDHTYLDGELIGSHPDGTSGAFEIPRSYRISGSRVTAGPHLLAVRVFDHFGDGGFTGPASLMRVETAAPGGGSLPLDGEWRFKVEHVIPLVSGDVFQSYPQPPLALLEEGAPAALFHGMIAPLIGMALRGALWYQGESNTPEFATYRDRQVALIRDWRTRWGQGQFPFYLVQLANSRRTPDWAWLREAQAQATSEPATGMVVTIDIGESDDIHPRNKQEVGRRLALWARARDYGETTLVCESPTLLHVAIVGAEVRVVLRGEPRLTTSDGQPPRGFQLAGADGVFHLATAHLEVSSVVVRSVRVPEPVAVRYAWADDPQVNLYDEHGLPVAPFRTDAQPVVPQCLDP